MNKFLLAIALALASVSFHAHADIEGTPFIPEIDARFDALEQGNHFKTGKYPAGSYDGHYVKQLAQASYNFSVVGGAAGTYDLGVSLPKNAIVTRSFLYSAKQPYGTSTPKLGFYCNSTYNLYNPQNTLSISADGTLAEGLQTGSAAAMSVIAAKCNIKATITQGVIQSGLVTIYVEYVVHQ